MKIKSYGKTKVQVEYPQESIFGATPVSSVLQQLVDKDHKLAQIKFSEIDSEESYLAIRWIFQMKLNSKTFVKAPSFLVYYGLQFDSDRYLTLIGLHGNSFQAV